MIFKINIVKLIDRYPKLIKSSLSLINLKIYNIRDISNGSKF